MKRIISLILTVVMLFGMMSVLSACGAPKDDGAEINVYLGDAVFDFDPGDYYVSDNAEQILALLYEPLFKLKKNGKVKCAAAKDYEVDEDERKITIELRESYWSDGVQVKASDYVYAWCERLISSAAPNPAAALFYDIEGVREVAQGIGSTSDVGIKATEMSKLEITYCEGADYKNILKNLASVAASPVRQDVVENAETYWAKSANTIVTNGPFKMKSYNVETGEFQLSRNLGYHQLPTTKDYDNKVNPGLIYTTFKNEHNDVSVSYKDIADKVVFVMTDLSLAERAEYAKKADTFDQTSTYTYVFNTKHPLLSDANVRKALSLVIDRTEIANAVTFAKPADGFIPDICNGSEAGLISVNANKAEAEKCMAKVDSALFEANKSITLTVGNDEESVKIAEIVKTAWESIGFSVTVEAVGMKTTELKSADGSIYIDDSTIQNLIKEASYGNVQYDVIAVDWQMYCRDAAVGLASLTSNINGMGVDFIPNEGAADTRVNRSNVAGWADSKYDELVNAIYAADGDKARKDCADKAEEYLVSAMPVCPILFNQSFVFDSSKISKLKYDGLGNLVFTDVKLGGYKKYLKPEEE